MISTTPENSITGVNSRVKWTNPHEITHHEEFHADTCRTMTYSMSPRYWPMGCKLKSNKARDGGAKSMAEFISEIPIVGLT